MTHCVAWISAVIFFRFVQCICFSIHCGMTSLLLQGQVFGRELKPGEFDRLDPAEQEAKSDELMDVIKRRLRERRRRQLKGGQN